VTPFDVNALVNGNGVGGQVNVNGTPVETAISCIIENPVNLVNGQRAIATPRDCRCL
jgi:hypothetical protein